MRLLSLRHLYKHLGDELKSLPFAITNHNKLVAVVHALSPDGQIVGDMNIITRKEKIGGQNAKQKG